MTTLLATFCKNIINRLSKCHFINGEPNLSFDDLEKYLIYKPEAKELDLDINY